MNPEVLAQMFEIMILGLLIVFSVLIILWAVIEIMHVCIAFFEKKGKKQTPPAAAPAQPQPQMETAKTQEDQEELIAVLTAAVAASLNTSTYNLKIKSFRRVGQYAPAWNQVSRKEQLENNL